MGFVLQSLTVRIGDTIVWQNLDVASHTVTSGTSPVSNGLFDSGTLTTNATYMRTFTAAGSYPYFCAIHPSMTATTTVSQ